MKILVTGATGFIGAALVTALRRAGHGVIALSRDPERAHRDLATRATPATPATPASDPGNQAALAVVRLGDDDAVRQALRDADGVVNLAGENLFAKRWTAARKQVLRDSRVATTERLVRLLGEARAAAGRPLDVLVSASAVGYYGAHPERAGGDGRGGPAEAPILDERAPAGDDFAAQLCRDWEAAALAARPHARRVVLARLGIVLGDGGALATMRPLFRAGLGGRLGSGEQWVSWIHLSDLIDALRALLEGAIVDAAGATQARPFDGPVNLVAPAPAQNHELTAALARAVRRPAVLPAPALALRLVMGGDRAEMLLGGQRVVPGALGDAGFRFRYPELHAAVAAAIAASGN
jgi:hypothetical protein